jgi:hypothetical protein
LHEFNFVTLICAWLEGRSNIHSVRQPEFVKFGAPGQTWLIQ